MLEISNLSTKLKKKQIINDITCQFETGVHGLLGPNGAGKTTFMRSMLGLYPQAKGSVSVEGTPISKLNIGYLPQKFGLFPNMTVRQALTYIGNLKKIPSNGLQEEIETLVSSLNLAEKIDAKMSTLSGGMIRRVGIAQAFLGNPPVVILDEPTAGLDPDERLRFKNYIKSGKGERIIIISTHIVDDIDYLSDYVEIMNAGSIVAQGTRETIVDYAEGKVFGVTEEDVKDVDYYLVKEYEENGTKKMRILCNKQISDHVLTPTLEDGYLCLLRKE